MSEDEQELLDAIVIGGGPAGIAAANWLARYRRKVIVIDSGEYRSRWTDETHGYLGSDPIDPLDLLAKGREELARYPTSRTIEGCADSATRHTDGSFKVLVRGDELRARRLVLATGVKDEFPEVANFFEHYGADVFHCPTCDGYEAKGKKIVVFGWTAQIASFALDLFHWAAHVTVITDGRSFEGDRAKREELAEANIEVIEDEATELVGSRGKLRAVKLRRGVTIDCELAFFSIAHRPRNELAKDLGCALVGEGCIEVDAEGRTSVEGVYAAGDITPGYQLVQLAAAKGATAGVTCALSL